MRIKNKITLAVVLFAAIIGITFIDSQKVHASCADLYGDDYTQCVMDRIYENQRRQDERLDFHRKNGSFGVGSEWSSPNQCKNRCYATTAPNTYNRRSCLANC